MFTGLEISTQAAFKDFELQDVPAHVQLLESGIFGNLTLEGLSAFVVRKALTVAEIGDNPETLYNGTLGSDGQKPWVQATEGHGMYAGNTPRTAVRTPFIKGKNLYLLKVDLNGPEEILDVRHAEADPTVTPEQQRAARWLRWRSIIPGVPGPRGLPGKSRSEGFDRLYGDRKLVMYPPLALARPLTGLHNKLGDAHVPVNWAIIRDLGSTTIVGRRLYKNNT